MAINFPNSPVLNQTHPVTGGATYIWTGTTWDMVQQTSDNGADVVVYVPAGTGAVSTTVKAKLDQTVSVKDFGAAGNGATDDTTAIQNAVDAISSRGGSVYFPAGKYLITSTITLPVKDSATTNVAYQNGVTLFGESAGASELYAATDITLISADGSASTNLWGATYNIHDMTISRNVAEATNYHLSFDDILRVVMHRVFVNNYQEYFTETAITAITLANPPVVTATAHGLVTGDYVRIRDAKDNGMVELFNDWYLVTRIDDNNYSLDDVSASGYTAYDGTGATSQVPGVGGLKITQSGNTFTWLHDIHDCWFRSSSILMDTVSDSKITNCYVWGTDTDFAIKLNNCSNIEVTNCDIIASPREGGVWIAGGANNTITGCFFDGSNVPTGNSVHLQTHSKWKVTDNTFWGHYYSGIYTEDSWGGIISSNVFHDGNRSDTAKPDIHFEGKTGSNTSIVVEGNWFRREESKKLTLTGTCKVTNGATLTQASSGATGVVRYPDDATALTTEVRLQNVTGTFNTANELTSSDVDDVLGANSVPTAVAAANEGYGILETNSGAAVTGIIYANNYFSASGNYLSPTIGSLFGNATTFDTNVGGATTAGRGVATITSGNTSIAITANLGYNLEDAGGVIVWPTNNPTNSVNWWVDTITGKSFTINVSGDPGASGATFGFYATCHDVQGTLQTEST